MQIIISTTGITNCIYSEEIELSSLGLLSIQRGSYVEPNVSGQWLADLSPVHGPKLGPYKHRSDALAAELEWLDQNWLPGQS